MKKIFILFSIVAFLLFACKDKEVYKDNINYNTEETEETKWESGNTEVSEDLISDTEQTQEQDKAEDKEDTAGNINDNDDKDISDINQKEKELSKVDNMILVGKINEFGAINGLKLYVSEDKDKSIDISDNALLGGELDVKDIDNDGIKDIIIYEFLGGSGNLQNIYVYRNTGKEIEKVMGPEFYIIENQVYMEYLGEGKIYLEDKNTGFKTEYNIEVPYENEEWSLEDVKAHFGMGGKAWVDPYSSFDLADLNNDGLYEITGSQILCGMAHVDIIGEITTIYSYDGKKYVPTEVIYYKVSHSDWKKEEIGRANVD